LTVEVGGPFKIEAKPTVIRGSSTQPASQPAKE